MRTKEERGSHNIPARAVEWFAKSAERGNPYAQYMLGKDYHSLWEDYKKIFSLVLHRYLNSYEKS